MKIIQTWKRNNHSILFGESITLVINYSSFNKTEIDELEKKMPIPMMTIMETKEKEEMQDA